ncbi:MAG: CxxxxCH/CxxCH domain-containing protein [Deltaproteobacteria bacterium]|nr:CxxxxCH/CxxCH domain-containing protein [Deltaproteobacteria bacterium]
MTLGLAGCGGSGGPAVDLDAGPDADVLDAQVGDGDVVDGDVLDGAGYLLPTRPTAPVGRLPLGPDCSECHGDRTSSAPPMDLEGRIDPSERGVGAHRNHLYDSSWHRDIVCTDCHLVPTGIDDPGHIDTPWPAELTFGAVPTSRGASPSFDGTSCSDVYCHGTRLDPGGTLMTPTWTIVDGSQAYCGSCHGVPPEGPHPKYDRCSVCHPTIDGSGTITDPDRHVDGLLDLDISGLTCTSCHGSEADGTPAPPRDTSDRTDTSERTVGAHRSHLGPSDWHKEVQCEACHIVPDPVLGGVWAVGHIDTPRPAEVTWGPLSTTDGATPDWSGTTCSGVYCHGETLLPGGSNTTPEWTTVDGTQAACGTCHSTPPGGSHPNSTDCAGCHPTMGPGMTITDPSRHIDGVVDLDLSGAGCMTCHGSELDGTPAPPRDTTGGTATTQRGVGAHRSHLGTSDWHAEVTCTDCHVVPGAVSDVGHIDTPLPAELTFGALATADAASPSFSGTTCSGVYCHGETLLPGGTNTTPNWTTVDGTQAACGTCHGLPPGGGHPNNTNCSACHPTMGTGLTIADPARHINGVVDVDLSSASCTTCHGSAADGTPAPPKDTAGNATTNARGVGAHRSHLGTSSWHKEVVCTDCHVVPAAVTDVGHIDTPLPAELTWGALARADAASPTFSGTTCSGVYCHGETLLPGGTNTTPNWTRVDGTQATCGTCHGLPPGGTHPTNSNCAGCHPTMGPGMTITDPARHINGVVDLDLGSGSCTTCHGSAADGTPAPPQDTTGNVVTSVRGVGAHRSHLGTSGWHKEVVCTDCHVVPATVTAAGHIDSALPAELTWGALATADGASPSMSGTTCSGVYCHGETLLPGGSNTTPNWTTVDGTQAACGTCHGTPPGGRHPRNSNCATCHPTMGAGLTITDPARHIDGVVNLDFSSATCTDCHGSAADGTPAPPRDTTGGTATARRGVGAHRSHLGTSGWHKEVVCTDCHVVPATVTAVGHMDTALPAELTWGALATADGASPSFSGTTCSGVYCHGETLLPGGTNTTPNWRTVNGTQAACGTCHGTPPGGTHPRSSRCSACHPTMGSGLTITDPARHINGVVDLDLAGATCTDCHGSAAAGTPAPPQDTSSNTATSVRGVGAHRSHLGTSTWHKQVVCTDCHIVPATVTAAGHIDTALPAELTWGALARADAASPSFDGTSCNGVYCHGETLLPGGTNTTPTWTTVNGTQAACGTCHGTPPGGTHPRNSNCSVCHPTMGAGLTIAIPARHINGVVDLDLSGVSCTDCHGSAADGTPAPPQDTRGRLATSFRSVGAHRSHLGTSSWHKQVVCTDCHIVPATVTAAGHIDTALPAELTFGTLAQADAASPSFDGTSCNGVYCHGETLLPGGTNTTPMWSTARRRPAAPATARLRLARTRGTATAPCVTRPWARA